jgi:dolichol-phosphate mannosyltransferase
MKKISIILPTFNERHNIVQLIKMILRYLPRQAECIVVDDDSPDGTGKLVQKQWRQSKRVKCFIRKNERGLGTAINFGLEQARGDIVIIMDADFNHQPRYLPDFIQQAAKSDLVCGSRYVKGGGMPETPIRFLGSLLFNLFIQLILNIDIKDNLSGFVAIRRQALKKLSPQEKKAIFRGFGEWYIRLIWWAKKESLTIKEIPVKYGSRAGDESKMNFTKSLVDYTKVVIQLKLFGLR